MRKRIWIPVALTIVLGLGACGGDSPTGPKADPVPIRGAYCSADQVNHLTEDGRALLFASWEEPHHNVIEGTTIYILRGCSVCDAPAETLAQADHLCREYGWPHDSVTLQ